MKIVRPNSKLILELLSNGSLCSLAGLDVGSRVVGVAISDQSKSFVQPLSPIFRTSTNRMSDKGIVYFSKQLNTVIQSHRVGLLVVGIPVLEGAMTPFCNEIVNLMSKVDIPDDVLCTFWDESYSTQDSQARLSSFTSNSSIFRKHKDGMSAGIILKSFLSYHGVT